MNPSLRQRVVLFLAILGSVWIAGPNSLLAYERSTSPVCQQGKHWSTDVVLSYDEGSFPTSDWVTAIHQTTRSVGAVDGSWLDVTPVAAIGGDYDNGRSELWFADELRFPYNLKDSDGFTSLEIEYSEDCRIVEGDIVFLEQPDTGGFPLTFHPGIPEGFWEGDCGWTSDGQVFQSLRPPLLHELMHLAGFAHEENDYSMLNYFSACPWLYGDTSSEMLQPLPTDRAGLRALYSATGEAADDLAVSMSILLPGDSAPGLQLRACLPSVGKHPTDPYFDETSWCATEDFSWCPGGNPVTAAFTILNLGTRGLDVRYSLALSADEEFSADDLPLVAHQGRLEAGQSKTVYAEFLIPEIPDGAYHPFARIESAGGVVEKTLSNNAIRLSHPGFVVIRSDRCTPSCTYDGTSASCEALAQCDSATCTAEFEGRCNPSPPYDCRTRVCCDTEGGDSCCSDWEDLESPASENPMEP